MFYNLTLKGYFENFTINQGLHLIGKGHVAYQPIHMVGRPEHLWCFHCSSWSLPKAVAEKLLVTFHDLK